MNILLIDGEYYRNLYDLATLKDHLIQIFGLINYPDKIIYYSAAIDKEYEETLIKIKNLKINNEGFLSQGNRNKPVQKGVNGYILRDILLSSQNSDINNIYLIAGDGDLVAGIEYALIKNKPIQVISSIKNTSCRIKEVLKPFYFEELFKQETYKLDNLSENEKNLKKMWESLTKDKNNKWLSTTKIGQQRKIFDFKYNNSSLKEVLGPLVKRGVIVRRKEKNGPEHEILFQ